MTLNNTPKGSNFVDWKSTLYFIIPAQSLPRTRSGAGIQVFIGLAARAKMDAGMRRHDKSSLPLKSGNFNQPEIEIFISPVRTIPHCQTQEQRFCHAMDRRKF